VFALPQLKASVNRLMRLIFMMNHMLACVWWYIGSESYFMSSVYQEQERWISHYEGFGCAPLAEIKPEGGFVLREGDSTIGLKTCATLIEQYCVRCVGQVPPSTHRAHFRLRLAKCRRVICRDVSGVAARAAATIGCSRRSPPTGSSAR